MLSERRNDGERLDLGILQAESMAFALFENESGGLAAG